MDDSHHMTEALRLAKRGLGRVSPNPMVGAVVVKDHRIVSKGWHRAYGGPHAEVDALRDLEDCRGMALYVTLEPCAMCAGAIVNSRIPRLVVGAMDPRHGCCGSVEDLVRHPRLNHRVELATGVLEKECAQLLKDFFRELRKRK